MERFGFLALARFLVNGRDFFVSAGAVLCDVSVVVLGFASASLVLSDVGRVVRFIDTGVVLVAELALKLRFVLQVIDEVGPQSFPNRFD